MKILDENNNGREREQFLLFLPLLFSIMPLAQYQSR